MKKILDYLLDNFIFYIQFVVLLVLAFFFYLGDSIRMFIEKICDCIKVLADAIKADAIDRCKKYEVKK